MEKYENLGLVGEGSYGMVLKCKHKETGQFVAIKKFLESEDDKMVKKIALREVRMLKQLRNEHLVNLIEVFRRKKRLYLVFEFMDHTVLDDLEKYPNGLDEITVKKVLWQVLKGIEFCHNHNIIHRDIKPENILVSKSGIVKLCDFGFARTMAQPGETYTDYVATRWYRAPELLVGDTKYGRAVDIWAIGCLQAEMLTGEPLFPGDSDIDQLYHIVKVLGNLPQRHREIFHKNPLFVGMRLPEVRETEPIERKFPRLMALTQEIMKMCMRLEASDRPTCSQLLRHEYFTKDNFAKKFAEELKVTMQREYQDKPLIKSSSIRSSANRTDKDSTDENADLLKKKKKEKERREAKENSEDKPKRKLPDPEKIAKKVTPPSSNLHPSLPPAAPAASRHSYSDDGSSSVTGISGATGMPPIQSSSGQPSISSSTKGGTPTYTPSINNLSLSSPTLGNLGGQGAGPRPLVRVSDNKVKKAQPNLYKKQPPPNHHSSTLSPQPILQTEKTSLHDKTFTDKSNAKRKSREGGGLSLPEVKGAEANPNKNKNKKGYVATIPHIATLDFQDSQDTPPTPDKDSNLPVV